MKIDTKEYELTNITKYNLSKLDKHLTFIPLTYDKMFKSLFENNTYILKRFLISVLHLDMEPDEFIIHFGKSELTLSNYNEYKKTVDFNIDINNKIYINIEVNRSQYEKVKRRNRLYFHKIISMNLNTGDNLDKLAEITNIQLNLNVVDNNKELGEYIITPYNIIDNKIEDNNEIIYLRYLEYYRNLYYTKNGRLDNEADYWLALLTSKSFVELNDILSKFVSKELRENIIKDVYNMSLVDNIHLTKKERKALDKVFEYESKRYDEEMKKRAREEGIEENTIEMIKSMLENKADLEFISKVSNKSVEEIKEIAKGIEL